MVKCSHVLLVLLIMTTGIRPAFAEKPTARLDPRTGQVSLVNGRLELLVETQQGLDPRLLRDRQSGQVYADADYVWPDQQRPTLVAAPVVTRKQDGSCIVTFTARAGTIEIEQTFGAPADEHDVITESIRLHNPGDQPVDTSHFACGFAKKLLPDLANARFCNVPYRRHPETGELCDYTVAELTTKQSWYSTVRSPIYDRQNSSAWGAEGWAWYGDGHALLITKYNPDAMEWSLLEPLSVGNGKLLRFGGAGRWKLGDPEGVARLAPGGAFAFGTTRYQVLDGDWKPAYAAFRRFTERQGHRVPANFDPPVHWNELWDNPLWGAPKPDTWANRHLYYRRQDMEIEAEKGHDLGCQCLYLDPGWDTSFGSNLWADDRLGTEESFVSWLKEKYGMALALHTPLAPWSDPAAYPADARRMGHDGKRLDELCCASRAYEDVKVARLKELCRQGAYFLMYDGSWFAGECWDPSHGHSVPLTHQEHLDAILRIAQRVHAVYPHVLIEQHDPMTGPGTPRYAPTYVMHGKPGAFDDLWGFEYMIDPMDDILSHRAASLYYLNLAYSIPVYLHIDLRKDNDQAMMLWWYASTCRHLGVGGKPADPAVWAAQKAAMRTYLALKPFFAQGIFYGLDESVHAHILPDRNECVLNCFNLETKSVTRPITFRLAEVGLPAGRVEVEGAPFTLAGDTVTLNLTVPARGHQLVKLHVSP